MTTITKEQAEAALGAMEWVSSDDSGAPAPVVTLRAYITQLEERVKVLEEFAEWSSHNWDNQDISHADFRVLSAGKSKHALAGGKVGA